MYGHGAVQISEYLIDAESESEFLKDCHLPGEPCRGRKRKMVICIT